MDVMQAAAERAATGADVIHMEVGQPATPAPRAAIAAVIEGDTDDAVAGGAAGEAERARQLAQHLGRRQLGQVGKQRRGRFIGEEDSDQLAGGVQHLLSGEPKRR